LIDKGVAGSLDALRLVLKLAARFAQAEATATASGDASSGKPSRKAKKKARARAKAQLGGESAAAEAADAAEPLPERHEADADGNASTVDVATFASPTEGSVLSMDQGGQDRALDDDGDVLWPLRSDAVTSCGLSTPHL
jgi:hypothetical protein